MGRPRDGRLSRAPLLCALAGALVLSLIPGEAHPAPAEATVSEMPLPGGLRAALAAIGDTLPPDRAQFLVEFIRRHYDAPSGGLGDSHGAAAQVLIAHLEAAAARERGASADTIPLPLTQRIWMDVVLKGRVTPSPLVSAILRSRSAALMYCALLALDDDTRAWIAGERALLSELSARYAGSFLAVAPGVRMTAHGINLPGGPTAAPVWRALVGTPSETDADFLRALVAADRGHLAYVIGALSQLTPEQSQVLLNLDTPDAAARVDGARRMYGVYRRVLEARAIEYGALSRPTLEPALLISELRTDVTRRPQVPGTRGFWRATFSGDHLALSAHGDPRLLPDWETPADFPWLCEQVFASTPAQQRRRYMMVLFASRRLEPLTSERAMDAVDAVRGAAAYPALSAALERAGITDIGTFAAAARRAESLSQIGDYAIGVRALMQFQAALALVTHAASRGSLNPPAVNALVSSLSAVRLSDRGEYEGRIAEWLRAWIDGQPSGAPLAHQTQTSDGLVDDVVSRAAGSVEQRMLGLLSGPGPDRPVLVEWEGTRYRLDFPFAEALRMTRAIGESPIQSLGAATALAEIADASAAGRLTLEQLRDELPGLATTVRSVTETSAEGRQPPGMEALAALRRAGSTGAVGSIAKHVIQLRRLADDLVAHGLVELAYAAALGPHDGVSLTAAEAASRHDFGLRPSFDRLAAWRPPRAGNSVEGRWRVTGALLGLDVALADFRLVRLSLRPLPRPPTLNDLDREAFTSAVALVDSRALTAGAGESIVEAIRRGRVRLAGVRTASEALAVADDAGIGPIRRTLLSWTVGHDAERLGAFLSPSELLWAGQPDATASALDAWGAPAGPRRACLCLQVVERRPWETYSGRHYGGLMASIFPDLNLRLVEILRELRMPPSLLAPMLASATRDFIDRVVSRDPDDRRGLVEFVQALGPEQVEQYLAMLTTDGPLVPLVPEVSR